MDFIQLYLSLQLFTSISINFYHKCKCTHYLNKCNTPCSKSLYYVKIFHLVKSTTNSSEDASLLDILKKWLMMHMTANDDIQPSLFL